MYELTELTNSWHQIVTRLCRAHSIAHFESNLFATMQNMAEQKAKLMTEIVDLVMLVEHEIDVLRRKL